MDKNTEIFMQSLNIPRSSKNESDDSTIIINKEDTEYLLEIIRRALLVRWRVDSRNLFKALDNAYPTFDIKNAYLLARNIVEGTIKISLEEYNMSTEQINKFVKLYDCPDIFFVPEHRRQKAFSDIHHILLLLERKTLFYTMDCDLEKNNELIEQWNESIAILKDTILNAKKD